MKPATVVVHWPGKGTPACEDHAKKLISLGESMGFPVSTTQCEETVCMNCINEKAKER